MAELHQIGEVVRSRYRLDRVLGEGGMGITYAATDLQTGDRVAIKALSFRRMKDWKVLELFEREANVLAHLDHPAIPRYLDYFQIDHDDDRDFYIVQELVEGRSLAQSVDDGWHGNEAEIKKITEQVLEVLIYLHELKPPVIHRDIKPQNIILQPNKKIALVDFGAVQDTYRNTQVGSSTVVGTYGYMPPEQFRGKSVAATDLYALGATILFLLTGRSPSDLPEIKFKINFRNAVNVSPQFADWLDKMIEPAIEDRFSSARIALKVLQNFLQSEVLSSIESRIRGIESDRQSSKRLPKPLGSQIEIKRTYSSLEVSIPPIGWRSAGVSILFFAVFWNGFLFFWTSLALRAGIFALFSIPFWIIGIGIAYAGLSSVFGRTRIVIGDRTFRIDWDVLGVKRHAQGRTENLRRVEMKSSYEVNEKPVMCLALNEGIYPHKFGEGLNRVEKEWLLEEINDFLDTWRSRTD